MTVSAKACAVLGSPVAHSLSPVLHLAAYRELGLADWTYDRIDCTAEQFPGLVGALDERWRGLSVTMPNKVAALRFADVVTERAELVGTVNTLVHGPLDDGSLGWSADCTDIDGVHGALAPEVLPGIARGLVVGAGATARAALAGIAALGVSAVVVAARDADRARATLDVGSALGMTVDFLALKSTDVGLAAIGSAAAGCDVAVSTVPAAAAEPFAEVLASAPVVLDAIYDPWPTPLAEAVTARGHVVVDGTRMLLHQAFGQVEQFTGLPAPRAAMEAALTQALEARLSTTRDHPQPRP